MKTLDELGKELQKAHEDFERYDALVSKYMLDSTRPGCLKQAIKKKDAARERIKTLRRRMWKLSK